VAFDRFWQEALDAGPDAVLAYQLPYPRVEFLTYLGDEDESPGTRCPAAGNHEDRRNTPRIHL
jgi:hypothetical protein